MKKALKRLSSLVVCGTLSLTLFAGCSGSSSDTSSTAAGSAVSGSTSASAIISKITKLQFIYCFADFSKDTFHSTQAVDVLVFLFVLVPVDQWSSL